jgi:hypothetical protein
MPTQTNQVSAAGEATEPVTFDWGFSDPHLAATSSGNTAAGSFSAAEVSASVWFIAPDPIGPFDGPGGQGTVNTGMVAHTRAFDLDASSSTGDLEQIAVDPNAPDFTPVTVAPGEKGTMTAHHYAQWSQGRTVRGTLYVDAFSPGLAFTNEVLAIPYEYTVG